MSDLTGSELLVSVSVLFLLDAAHDATISDVLGDSFLTQRRRVQRKKWCSTDFLLIHHTT